MGVIKYVTTWIPVVVLIVCILGFKYHTVAALQACSHPTKVYYDSPITQTYCFEGSPHKPKYCKRLCPKPRDIMNGKVEFTSIMKGGVATYSCNSGYGMVGSSSQLTCHRSGEWSDSPPRCYKLVQCPEVNDPTNGCAFKEHLVRGIGDIVEYTCSSGYDLVGSYIRTCQPDGTWTKNTPQCIIQLAPQVTTCAGAGYTGCCTTGNTSCFVPGGNCFCDITCHEFGDCCDDIDENGCSDSRVCPVLDPPSNGNLVISTYIINSNAFYSCNSGYQLVGSSKRNCLSTGSWSNSPPTCNRVCPRPTDPINGLVLKLGRDRYPPTSFFVGDRARYGCYYGLGLALKGPRTLTCLSDGRWSGPSPTCDRTCYSLKNPNHGTVNVNSYFFGDFAHYTCDTGYVLKGLSDRRCESYGVWSGWKPVCIRCSGSGSGSGSESGSGDCNCLNGGSCYFDDGIADLEDGGIRMACNCPPGFRGDKCQDA